MQTDFDAFFFMCAIPRRIDQTSSEDSKRGSLQDSEPIAIDKPQSDNPFLVSEDAAAANPFENPFLNVDPSELDDSALNDNLDPNNNLNVLSDKLDTGLSVKDTSPLPNCPPSSPFTGDIPQDGASPESVERAINKLSSEG